MKDCGNCKYEMKPMVAQCHNICLLCTDFDMWELDNPNKKIKNEKEKKYMIKVTCRVETYEIATPSILIHNHWNDNKMVEIEIENKKYIVLAKDMKTAIDNCSNTAKY